ncbi:cyanophycinase [Thalassotalea sp. LPB0316]|uniref:cyanophycinase n=1 Tax=Thalassotalea sp. LPB0316 TaxID=2769490 RepID=UPI001866A6E6|nr:cyanophycinase [Thalassotalea sp. LPB0316]QOL25731.1 cyanophycinase [Thalassotalea sp. LPB0316]
MRLFSAILLLFSAITLAKTENTPYKPSQLFLVGGGLKSCSSMSKNQCLTPEKHQEIEVNNSKTHALFQLNHKTRAQVFALMDQEYSAEHAKQLKKLLNKAIKNASKTPVSKGEMVKFLKTFDNNQLINRLSDPEYFLLLDALEIAQIDKVTGERLQETVDLDRSKNSFTPQIYRDFVKRAQRLTHQQRPHILVVTASARDSFEAVDFYIQAFVQAGANTQWLPIDASLQPLISATANDRANLCDQLPTKRLAIQKSAYREAIYPDLVHQQRLACLEPQRLLEQVKQADGIFINGGDQSLTKQAFIKANGQDTEVMALIREKFDRGNFIIGGTSAGTAVMAGGQFNQHAMVMITSGQSDRAMFYGAHADVVPTEGCQKSNTCNDAPNDQLTYATSGGLGLFNLGILDTHFSERGRQGRLAVLAHTTQHQLAFGVDERTALVVTRLNQDKHELSVVGQSGVFIVENPLIANNTNANNTDTNNTPSRLTVKTHYIHQGDSLVVNDTGTLKFSLSKDKVVTEQTTGLLPEINNIFAGENYLKAAKLLCLSDQTELIGNVSYDNQRGKVIVTKTEHSVSVQGLYQLAKVEKHDCSYTHYQLTLSH